MRITFAGSRNSWTSLPLGSLRDGTLAATAAAGARFDLIERLQNGFCRQVTPASDARALLCIDVQRVLSIKGGPELQEVGTTVLFYIVT